MTMHLRAWRILRTEGIASLLARASNYLLLRLSVVFSLYYHRLKNRLAYGSTAPDPTELVHVDPNDVTHELTYGAKLDLVGATPGAAKELLDRGSFVVDGDWDRHGRSFVDTSRENELYETVHESLLQRYERGLEWEDTELAAYLEANDVSSPKYREPERRFEELDRLFESLRGDGYRSQERLPGDGNELTVAIGRDGQVFRLMNGNHRLRMAQILDLDRIAVRVGLRHREWQRRRIAVARADSIDELDEVLRDHLDHPDVGTVSRP